MRFTQTGISTSFNPHPREGVTYEVLEDVVQSDVSIHTPVRG